MYFSFRLFSCEILFQSFLLGLETHIVCEVWTNVALCLTVNIHVAAMSRYIILKYITFFSYIYTLFSSWKELQSLKQIKWYFLYMKKIFVDGKFHTSTLCNAGIPIVFLGFPSGSLDFFWILWISRIPIEFLGFQRFLMDFQGFEVPRIRCFPLISKSPFNRLLL